MLAGQYIKLQPHKHYWYLGRIVEAYVDSYYQIEWLATVKPDGVYTRPFTAYYGTMAKYITKTKQVQIHNITLEELFKIKQLNEPVNRPKVIYTTTPTGKSAFYEQYLNHFKE